MFRWSIKGAANQNTRWFKVFRFYMILPYTSRTKHDTAQWLLVEPNQSSNHQFHHTGRKWNHKKGWCMVKSIHQITRHQFTKPGIIIKWISDRERDPSPKSDPGWLAAHWCRPLPRLWAASSQSKTLAVRSRWRMYDWQFHLSFSSNFVCQGVQ